MRGGLLVLGSAAVLAGLGSVVRRSPGSRAFLACGGALTVYRGVRSSTCGICPDARGVTYWTDDPVVARSYAGGKPAGVVYSACLDFQNLYDMTTDAAVMQFVAWADEVSPDWAASPDGGYWTAFELVDRLDMPEILERHGYDGVVFTDVVNEEYHASWAIWNTHQVKYRNVHRGNLAGSAASTSRSKSVQDRQARAVRVYGTTENPHSAGFVLTSGDWLDFSGGRGGQRAQDHRNIAQLLPPAERAPDSSVSQRTDDMHRWMDLAHAVRVNVSGNYRRGEVDVMLDLPCSRAGLLDVQANGHVLQRFLRDAGATRVEVNGVVRRPRMLWDGGKQARRLRTEHVMTEIDPYRWHAVASFIQSVLDNAAPRQDEPYGSER